MISHSSGCSSNPKKNYSQQAYLWISVALAIPVFAWPVFLSIGLTPSFGVSIEENWLIAACCLLLAVVVADSLLSCQNKAWNLIVTGLWVVLTSSVIAWVIRHPEMIWMIAILFAIRSLHSLYPLWQGTQPSEWWHWIAWWRDGSVACTIFLWLHFWPQ